MGIKKDVEEAFKYMQVTKIKGHCMDQDLNNIESKLMAIAAIIPISHGHVGTFCHNFEYRTFLTGGESFVISMNSGAFPMKMGMDPVVLERQVAEHKSQVKEFKTYFSIQKAL